MDNKKPTLNELAAKIDSFLGTVSYKPGFRFRALVAMNYDIIEISISRHEPDSTREDAFIVIASRFEIFYDAAISMDYVRSLLIYQIRAMELHEMDEWLKIDGKRVKDPHPKVISPSDARDYDRAHP